MTGSSVVRVPIPRTRDPFVNTPLVAVGRRGGDGDSNGDNDGVEQFWISSYNSNVGCIGLLVGADGRARSYRFPMPHAGFYSAVPDEDGGLWLCGDLSRVVHLRLSDGAWTSYETGADPGLVFQGMARDVAGDQLLVAAFTGERTDAVCFDTRARKTRRLYRDISPQHYLRANIPAADAADAADAVDAAAHGSVAALDGSVAIAIETPETELLRWDPATGDLSPGPAAPAGAGVQWRLLSSAGVGLSALLTDLPPELAEVRWFAADGALVWGARCGDAAEVVVWDRAARSVRSVCAVPDSDHFNLVLTADRKLLAVTRYGQLWRFDALSGAVELCVDLDTDSVGRVDCVVRLDERTVLGTPFISQRYWTADLESRIGRDRGRAAPGGGQISLSWLVGGRAYLAAYAGGELTCLDPAVGGSFPENPRVVAAPPGGMRPVAGAVDGDVLVYSCTRRYGLLGCVLTRYDISTGVASYRDDPLPYQSIQSLLWASGEARLLAGTARHADMTSAPPQAGTCYLGLLDPDGLRLDGLVAMPPGADRVAIAGRLSSELALCHLSGLEGGGRWFATSMRAPTSPSPAEYLDFPAEVEPSAIAATGVPGWFVVRIADRIELWDLARCVRLRELYRVAGAYRVVVQDDDVFVLTPTELIVLGGVLAR